jgi:hypothetical protein
VQIEPAQQLIHRLAVAAAEDVVHLRAEPVRAHCEGVGITTGRVVRVDDKHAPSVGGEERADRQAGHAGTDHQVVEVLRACGGHPRASYRVCEHPMWACAAPSIARCAAERASGAGPNAASGRGMIKRLASCSVFLFAAACGSKGGGSDSSPCGKAALPLAGIVVLEVKDSGKDPSIMDTFERELIAECKTQRTEETAKDALLCYDKNHTAMGYRLFKACPEQPGRALVDAVVAKHGRRE